MDRAAVMIARGPRLVDKKAPRARAGGASSVEPSAVWRVDFHRERDGPSPLASRLEKPRPRSCRGFSREISRPDFRVNPLAWLYQRNQSLIRAYDGLKRLRTLRA